MPVFYEVATLDNPLTDPPFALIRVNTDKPVGAGWEGTVVSLHWTDGEARAAADLAASKPEGRS